MQLPIKPPDRVVPDYSLTGDVLSFSRCQRSYRYYSGSSLPPSRPVQMWYGEFIHGMMERTFRLWQQARGLPFPLSCSPLGEGIPQAPPEDLDPLDLRAIGWPIEQALAHQGKFARSSDARLSAYERAVVAINELGPHLFPLIEAAERKVIGTRLLPPAESQQMDRAGRYILQGIIDVLGHAQLTSQPSNNIFKDAIARACPGLDGEYEIIVDYKGARRPPVRTGARNDWQLGEWQVQTYAWLRSKQVEALPTAAGILVYINELSPGSKEMSLLRRELRRGETDIVPERGDPDYYEIQTWSSGAQPNLSLPFRLRRAIRVIPVSDDSMRTATEAIDRVIRAIEDRVSQERQQYSIRATWEANSQDYDTCVACDFRASCETYNESPPSEE